MKQSHVDLVTQYRVKHEYLRCSNNQGFFCVISDLILVFDPKKCFQPQLHVVPVFDSETGLHEHVIRRSGKFFMNNFCYGLMVCR